MKKILLLIVAAVGAVAVQKKLKDQQAEKDLWAEATDSPS
ncbi:DLW-39 family protein [Pedococcus sp. KACC 23699]|uniref:DLW-39 family protein n=1 Tax=Pedococcus sp. KACC 23699 TaxID=3149228 RepID=A0AAU7JYA3_9MICO